MAVKVFYKGNAFSDVVLSTHSFKSYKMESEKEVFPNVYLYIKEDEENILLNSENLEVEIMEENGSIYPVFRRSFGVTLLTYNKDTRTILGETKDVVNEFDVETLREWLTKVLFLENKYMYSVYSKMARGNYSNRTIIYNTIRFINEKTFDQLEGVIKNLGMNFFETNIVNREFELKNAKKLHRVVELPKQVLDFMKANNLSNQFVNLKLLASNNQNEVIYLTEWYETFKKYKNVKSSLSRFEDFVMMLADIKKNFEKLDLFRFIPYIMGQKFWYEISVDDKFGIPYYETREYRDYINLKGHLIDPYPLNLTVAHNILTRNTQILLNEEVCEKFKTVVKKYETLEWAEPSGKYLIKSPKVANDFVEEGNALKHCLATYVELVANGQENVMFIRSATNPNESFITFAFDEDYNAIEVKQIFNEDVEDPEIYEVLRKWKIRNKQREGK